MTIGTATAAAFFPEDGSFIDISSLILFELQAASVLGYRAFGRACSSALKYGEPTLLSESICEFAHTDTIEEAFAKTEYGQDISALPYQHFAPYVFTAACKNDKVSMNLVNEIGAGLAGYIRAGILNLGLINQEVPFILSGGALKESGYILENAIRNCLADLPHLKLTRSRYEPVFGALMLAYDEYYGSANHKVASEDISLFGLNRY